MHLGARQDEATVARLLACGSLPELDRALVDACAERDCGVELWRRTPTGWTPLFARGPRELFPSDSLVRAALAGSIDGHLPGGARVLANAASTALVFAAPSSDAFVDGSTAWLALHAALARALPTSETPYQPPLPERG
jgi:hypothetical protein